MEHVLSNWDQFACLCEWELWNQYAAINIELIHERMVLWMQTESYPVDKDCIGSLRIIIIFFKLDGFLSYLFKFGNNFLLGQVFQDLHFVDFKDLRKEFLSCSSTSLSICVDVNWSEVFDPQLQSFFTCPFCSILSIQYFVYSLHFALLHLYISLNKDVCSLASRCEILDSHADVLESEGGHKLYICVTAFESFDDSWEQKGLRLLVVLLKEAIHHVLDYLRVGLDSKFRSRAKDQKVVTLFFLD